MVAIINIIIILRDDANLSLKRYGIISSHPHPLPDIKLLDNIKSVYHRYEL